MWPLLEDPFGRRLLTILTLDHGLPGDPRRKTLLQALQELRVEAEAQFVSAPVRRAIHSALRSMRSEFPAVCATAGPARAPVLNAEYAKPPVGHRPLC